MILLSMPVSRDVAKGEGRECAPTGVFVPPRAEGAAKAKTPAEATETGNPHRSHEICAETDEKARSGQSGPARKKNRAPELSGNYLSNQQPKSSSLTLMNIRAPLTIRGPPKLSGALNYYQETSDYQGLTEYQRPSNGPFADWGP